MKAILASVFFAVAAAQYPPGYIDFNGGDTAAVGKGMQAMMGGLKPPVEVVATGGGGQFPAKVYEDPGLKGHTIYVPKASPPAGQKWPLFVFGNGGCLALGQTHGRVLTEIASNGYVVIANGAPGNAEVSFSKNTDMFDAINWAEKTDAIPVDATKVATGGQSCGGMQAYTTAQHPNVKATIIWNSGLLGAAANLRPKLVDAMKHPIVYFLGGSFDVANTNGHADYAVLTKTPTVLLVQNVGHGGTMSREGGGAWGKASIEWLNWHLKSDESKKAQFITKGSMPDYTEHEFKNWA